MDSNLTPNEEVLIDGTVDISEDNCNELPEESNITAEDVVMNCDANEIPNIESNQQNGPPIDVFSGDINSKPNPEIETKSDEQKPADNLLGNEEVLANDVMNLDVNEEIINNTNEEITQESQQVIESQNSSANDSHRLSNDEDITSDTLEIKNESNSDLPNEDIIDINNELNGPTISLSADEEMSDSDLRIAGLKTSLMLSEEKNKELEEELKKVYQHLFKCLDEKKNLLLKCETLEEQLDKIMATTAQKRPAQESPGAIAKSTPPKKAPNNEMNKNNTNNNQKNKKSVRFQEQRPYFGSFGARFRDNDMTPPPFPGPFAPAFIPPPTASPSRVPIGAFRAPPFMTSPEMTDLVLTDAFQLISNIGNRLHLTATIVDRAIRLFRQCYESPLRAMCRTQNQSTASACVYIACREEYCPQSIKTLCSVSKIDIKVMNQCCKYIVNTLGLCLDQITPEDAVIEFCVRSGFSSVIQRAAQQIAWKALQMNLLPPKSPQTAAAAAVFLASMASEDQRPVFEISQLTGIGDTTIRNAYNRMLPYARQLFPPKFPFFLLPEQMPRL